MRSPITLADLVQDKGFRRSVREFFHSGFASRKAVTVTSPAMMARIEAHRLIEMEAWEAVARFSGVLDRYLSLMTTIAGTPQPDPNNTGVSEQWVAAAAL